MKKYSYTALASMVSMSLTLMICQSVTHASDIEIYSNSTNGKTTITLMLDTSGSMSIEQVGSSACDLPSGASNIVEKSIISNTSPAYTRRYCEVGGGMKDVITLSEVLDQMVIILGTPVQMLMVVPTEDNVILYEVLRQILVVSLQEDIKIMVRKMTANQIESAFIIGMYQLVVRSIMID